MRYIVYINDAGLKLGEIIQKEKPDFTLIHQKSFSSVDYSAIDKQYIENHIEEIYTKV